MTKEFKIRFLRIYSVLLSIVIIVAGICLMAGCLSIYNSGDHPYSREVVASTFSGIAFPVYTCLAMTILSFVLELIFPSEKKRPQIEKAYNLILERLHKTRDLNSCDKQIVEQITSLRKGRKQKVLIRTIVILITSIAFLIYALNFSNYDYADINGSMIKAMIILIPCLLVAFAYALFTALSNARSIEKEIELMQQLPAINNASKDADKAESDAEDVKIRNTRFALLAVAVFFIVFGFFTGGTADVLAKAINICTECIGLG